MHSYHGKSANFHFNGGLDNGEVIINDKKGNEMRVDVQDILDLVAYEYVQPKLIREIENMEVDKLLGDLASRYNNKSY